MSNRCRLEFKEIQFIFPVAQSRRSLTQVLLAHYKGISSTLSLTKKWIGLMPYGLQPNLHRKPSLTVVVWKRECALRVRVAANVFLWRLSDNDIDSTIKNKIYLNTLFFRHVFFRYVSANYFFSRPNQFYWRAVSQSGVNLNISILVILYKNIEGRGTFKHNNFFNI